MKCGLSVWAAAAYESYSIWSLRCVLTALGAGRWTQLAIWLRGSLLGSEQKTHYPQWTKATERWFPLWKPLIPLLWVGGGGGVEMWKNASREELLPGCLARAWMDDIFKARWWLTHIKGVMSILWFVPWVQFLLITLSITQMTDRLTKLAFFSFFLFVAVAVFWAFVA